MDDSKYTSLHLGSGEHVIFEVRRHWIVFVTNMVGFLFLIIFPLALYVGVRIFLPVIGDVLAQHFSLVSFFYLLWFLAMWINFFLVWTKYFLDVWYVTGQRIIDVDQKRIFYRTVSNLRFDKIQDITIEIPGVLATFLNYGNIRVQTASEDNIDFYMTTVRNPNHVKEVIFSQHNNQDTKGSSRSL